MDTVSPRHEHKVTSHRVPCNRTKTKSTRTAEPVECSAWGMLALTLRLSRVFGMAPLTFEKTKVQQVWRIRVAPALRIYSYSLLLLLHAGVVGCWTLDLSLMYGPSASDRMYSLNSRVSFSVVLILTLAITSVAVLNAVPRMTMLIQQLAVIEQIYFEMYKGRKMSFKETKGCFSLVVNLLAGVALHSYGQYSFASRTIEKNRDMRVLYLNTCFFVELFSIMILQAPLIAIMLRVKSTFCSINETITDLIYVLDLQILPEFSNAPDLNTYDLKFEVVAGRTSNSVYDRVTVNTVAPAVTKTAARTFRRLNRAYGKAREVMQHIYQHHRVLLFLIISHRFVHLMQAPYYVIVFFNIRNAPLSMMLWPGLFYLLHIINLVMIVEPSHRVAREVWYTQILVGQLLRRASSPQDLLVQEVELFMQELPKNAYSFFGIFSLTRPFIVTVLGSVTTITVMVLSLENSKL